MTKKQMNFLKFHGMLTSAQKKAITVDKLPRPFGRRRLLWPFALRPY